MLVLPIDPSIVIFVVALSLLFQRIWMPYIRERGKESNITPSNEVSFEADEESIIPPSPFENAKAQTWDIIKDSFKVKYFILLISAVVFKELLFAGGAMGQLKDWFDTTGLNPVVVASVLPFFIGMLVGLTPGFIGVSFPILIAISGTESYGIFALAYVSGILGVLFSPVHVCLILTGEYFKCTLFDVYRKMVLPSMIQMMAGFALWILWS